MRTRPQEFEPEEKIVLGWLLVNSEYQRRKHELVKQIFAVQELPQGAYVWYEVDKKRKP